jgi:hypothetical protein
VQLSDIPHDFVTRGNELVCADGQNPRHRPLILNSDVYLHVQKIPWYGGEHAELMGLHQKQVMEISLCEVCYETIIIKLLETLQLTKKPKTTN